jgi:hypothetical protein
VSIHRFSHLLLLISILQLFADSVRHHPALKPLHKSDAEDTFGSLPAASALHKKASSAGKAHHRINES